MKPFAIYFPQFYPTPTNDKAWGSGFTDWALVANANMRDAWARRAPAAGYYDGASQQVHNRQIKEAKVAGIGGFALYHYWFYTHQELNAFEKNLLSTKLSDTTFPWFLIWATEGWSKRWLAKSDTLIHLSTAPTQVEIEAHCEYLATCFSNPAYMKWNCKPLFAWYNLTHFDVPESIVVRYREAMNRRGFDIAVAHFVKNPLDLVHCSYTDASYMFEPRLFFNSQKSMRGGISKTAFKVMRKILGVTVAETLLVAMDHLQKSGETYSQSSFLVYMSSLERAAWLASIKHPYQEILSPGWNNTPRYGDRFTELQPLDALAFGQLVSKALSNGELPPLINAWNEWTEGAAVEPCAYLGQSYLDAVNTAVRAHASKHIH